MDQIKTITNKFLSSGPKVKGGHEDPVLSSEVVSVLNHAEQMKITMGDNYLSVEHVLISFTEVESTVLDLFRELDLDKNKLLSALQEIRGSNKVDNTDPNLNEINLYTYEWKRHNFLLKNYTYSIGDTIQKLEIYTTDNNVSSDYLAHSSLLKIKDIMNICNNGKEIEDTMEILQKK